MSQGVESEVRGSPGCPLGERITNFTSSVNREGLDRKAEKLVE
jgi:hypothetical protein